VGSRWGAGLRRGGPPPARRAQGLMSGTTRPGPGGRRGCSYRQGRTAAALVCNLCDLSLLFICESKSDKTCVFLLVYVLWIDSNLWCLR
jgi:hypothetical protein